MSCTLPTYKVVITCVIFVTGFLPARNQIVTEHFDVSRTLLWPEVSDCCGARTLPLSTKEFGLHDLWGCWLSWLPFKLPARNSA